MVEFLILRACEIERKAYNDESELLRSDPRISKPIGDLGSDDREELFGANLFMDNWRQEFIEKYGDEP